MLRRQLVHRFGTLDDRMLAQLQGLTADQAQVVSFLLLDADSVHVVSAYLDAAPKQ